MTWLTAADGPLHRPNGEHRDTYAEHCGCDEEWRRQLAAHLDAHEHVEVARARSTLPTRQDER